ncbi:MULTISPECIES: DUF3857 domain-containing protein [unclassified Sphingomonas]|uniref:DUF3857 domain-containing protein n=1 Tax=Sphingomonas sp. GC_Shp_1 TaxID=2937385 RepID=UPI00226BA6A6|nr:MULTISPECIES: DUF3857 domain-containing protein [unclassified Sphingomonas]
MRRLVILALLGASSAGAQAADKVLFQPAPDWVKPAPAIDTAAVTDASPVVLLLDNQQRLQGGEVWTYADVATRVATSEMLGQAGTVSLPWQPAGGDLIVHRAEIIRGTEHIDLLKSGKGFSVIRREQQLEQRQLDGMLTATMPVEGLRVGDIVHLTFSITRRDAVLKGQMQGFTGLQTLPLRLGYARARLLWPKADQVHWKVSADGAAPVEADVGGYHELTLALPLPKLAELPADAPMRFRKLSLLEASSFPDWASVAAVMAPLYATDGLIAPGSPLAAEVTRIKTAESDPLKRTALALRLVQEQVRYLFNGMDQGNYVPQTPAQTWSLRYGDCKAKTVLLLALLHAMAIDAEPVLASSQLGDLLPTRLPAPGAFDHVLVKATVAGDTLWLDGTDNGARLADLHDTPPFRYVLPVRAVGAALMPIAMRPNGRPDLDMAIELDESAGVNLPAPMTATVTLRGRLAETIHAAQAQASKQDIEGLAEKLVGSSKIVTSAISYDEPTGTAIVKATGIAYPDWNRVDSRYRTTIDRAVSNLTFDPDRSRTTWKAIPAATGAPGYFHATTRIKLPDGGAGYTVDGDQQFAAPIAGTTITRSIKHDGGWLVVDESSTGSGAEVAPGDIAATRAGLAGAKSRLLSLVAPSSLPSLYQRVAAGKRAHAFDKTIALYDQAAKDEPDEAYSYTGRAWFQERIYERGKAIADLGHAIAIKPDAETYRWRARLFQETGNKDEALADLVAAQKLDPSSEDTVDQLARLEMDHGDKDAALALVQERIDAGGKGKPTMLELKAELLARGGDKDAALATIDQAIAASPGNANLLNGRCWIKGTLNIALDTALKDCTRSIELSESTTAALDSRAMVYFRMNRMDDALADLAAVLDVAPEQAASLFMRGVILGKQGKAEAKSDLIAARTIEPTVDETYKRFGIMP